MRLPAIFEELTTIAGQFGFIIRKEKGGFRGGNCVLNSQKIIVINVLSPYEIRVAIIARVLSELPLESVFLKPAVREYIARERKVDNRNSMQNIEREVTVV